jgi:lysophospholipase L1-like esterase
MKNNDPIRIFFFGDSICVGQYISIHKGWVTRTSARLTELAIEKGREVMIINSSVNGRTTRQALENMPYEIQTQCPDILIVQFGMNDCNYWQTDQGVPRVSPKAFDANLEEMITRAFTFGVKRVLLNTNHPTGLDFEPMPFTNISYQKSNEIYNQIIRDVAGRQDRRVILNDVEEAFWRHMGNNRERLLALLLPDSLHLNERGHELYFDVVYSLIEDVTLKSIRNEL